MKYETLLDEAYEKGLVVKEKPLRAHDGRIKGRGQQPPTRKGSSPESL